MRSLLASRGWIPWMLLAAFVTVAPTPALARGGGVDTSLQEHNDGRATCSGSACHAAASADVLVTISGPGTIAPGATESYTILLEELANPGQAGAGLNVHALVDGLIADGEEADVVLSEDNANTQITFTIGTNFLREGEVTHISPALSSGVFSYTFELTAPADAEEIELVGSMNAFNGNGGITGDKWEADSFVVTVPEPTSTALALTTLLGVALRRRASLKGCRISS